MTSEEKIIAAIKELFNPDAAMSSTTHLRDDLGLDSANLIELTVQIHSMYGIDLGRKAAEKQITPETIGDLAALVDQ